MIAAKSYAAHNAGAALKPTPLDRRDPGPEDVVIDILYCGVCHSDLHLVKDDLGWSRFPMVPGHEIVGVVSAVGSAVTGHKAGDRVGVGTMVNSCRHCVHCDEGEEQFCRQQIGTYGSIDRDGSVTMGGYSTKVTVNEHFVLKIPDGLDMAAAAPLLCAGATTWSPLNHWKTGPGSKVGVVGLGGLGHIAVKLAAGRGSVVTVISTSPAKREDALALGAHDFLVSTDAEAMAAAGRRFDLVLNTVSAPHDLDALLDILAKDGTMVMLGLANAPMPVTSLKLLMGRRSVAGSPIAGIPETQAMLDFCAEHGIAADIEMIRADQINDAYARLEKGDVRYRFVIDCSTMG